MAGGLTFNEAALLYCILGSNTKEGHNYPSVDEAIDYMMPKKKKAPIIKKQEVRYIQLSMFQ